jgi:hypothetical protein
MAFLGGSHHVAEAEYYFSHRPDVAVHVSVFGRKDIDVLKLDVMSQSNAIPYHGQLIQAIKTGISTVLNDPTVK